MKSDEMTDQITETLQKGINESIEQRTIEPIRAAALEAYRLRAGRQDLESDEAITNHIFPSDVEQTLQLSLQLVETDKEKAAIIYKGALEQIMNRLAVVLPEANSENISSWKFWRRTNP